MIDTERFHLRELQVEDATERYLAWLKDSAGTQYISVTALKPTRELSELRDYLHARIGRTDVLFLGIFDRTTGLHIGNVKFEPLDSGRRFAVMGILVGDPDYRGKGVAAEVLTATAGWLHQHRDIDQVVLGVSVQNPGAIRAYEKVGFALMETPFIEKSHPDQVTMVWRL